MSRERPPGRRRRDPWLWALLGLGAAGVAAALAATARGVGLSPDSLIYLETAQHALLGRGLVTTRWDGPLGPLTQFPPLYPLALAGLGVGGLDVAQAARGLNAALLGLSIVLVGLAINRFARPITPAAWLGAALVALSTDVVEAHAMAWSEPLFIALGLAGLAWLGAALERGRPGLLVPAGVALALAALDRLAGVALIAAGALAILAGRPWPAPLRWRRALGFAAGAAVPLALWVLWTRPTPGTLGGRALGFHVSAWQLKSGLVTASAWVLPGTEGWLGRPLLVLLGGGGLALGLLALWMASRRGGPATRAGQVTTRLGVLTLLCYLGILGLTMAFLDADVSLDARILAPAFVALVVVVFDRVRQLDAAGRGRTALLIGAALLLVAGVAQARFLARAYALGLGYAGRGWVESPTIGRVRALPADAALFTNLPHALRHLAGRPATGVPLRRNVYSMRPNPSYAMDVIAMRDRVLSGRAYVVWLPAEIPHEAHPTERELEQSLGLPVLSREAGGTIYGLAAPGR